jgi:hypothetical protein
MGALRGHFSGGYFFRFVGTLAIFAGMTLTG